MNYFTQRGGHSHHRPQSSSASRFTAGAARFLNLGASSRARVIAVLRRMRQRPIVLKHLSKVAAINPPASGGAPDEMLGLVLEDRRL